MTQNITRDNNQHAWPELPPPTEWEESLEAVHLWSQIIGKIRMAHTPPANHSWHVTLYVSSCGLTTSLIPHPSGGFEIEFNFVDHRLELQKVNGESNSFDLEPMSVADFYHKTLDGLKQLNIDAEIYPKPVELPDPIEPFPENTEQAPYEADAIQNFWLALTHIQRVFAKFQSGFLGKASPIHFFWGAFDLAVTAFPADRPPSIREGYPTVRTG